MATNDEEDDGFGDFTFAPPNPPLQSKPATSNLSSNDNDDWGDFMSSGGLSHALSLPKFSTPSDPFGFSTDQKIEKTNSDPVQPDSAPARAIPGSSFSAWKKPRGALPLSIFGLEEEESEEEKGSGVGDTSGVNGSEKVVNLNKNVENVSNLIGDVNKNNESGNGSVSDSNESVSNLFGSNLGPISGSRIDSHTSDLIVDDRNKNGMVSDSHGSYSGLNWGGINLNSTSLQAVDDKGNGTNSNSSKDWLFYWNSANLNPSKDSTNLNSNATFFNGDTSGSVPKEADLNSNKGVNSMGKDFDWDAVNLNPTASKTTQNDPSSISKAVNLNGNNGVNSMGMNFDWNAVNLNPNASKVNENGLGSVAKEVDLSNNKGVKSMGMDFDWNAVNLNPSASKVNENGLSSVANEVDLSNNKGVKSMGMDFDWDAVNLNPSASKFNQNETNSVVKEANGVDARVVGVNEGLENDEDEDDGWEFMAAESSAAAGVDNSENSKNENNNASSNQPNVFSSGWNALPSDFSSWNLNASVQNPTTDWLDKNVPQSNGQDGYEKAKDGQQMTEKVSNLPSVGSYFSSWNMLHSGFDNTNSILNRAKTVGNQNSQGTIVNDADAWGFKNAEPGLGLKTGNSKDNQSNATQADLSKDESGLQADFNKTNTSWNIPNVGGGWLDSNLTGVSSQTKQTDVKSLDEDDDWGTDDGWEFKAATATGSKVEDQRNTDDKGQDAGVTTDKFDFSNVGHNNRDLFATSQNEKFGQWDAGFDFKPNSSTQKDMIPNLFFQSQQTHTENQLHSSSFDGNSVDNSWAFNDPFPETGLNTKEKPKVAKVFADQEAFALDSEIQGTKVSSNKNKGALPLSIFGEEEQESGDPVIGEDTTAQKPNNSVVGTKSTPSVSITDLISSLYSQAEESGSGNHAQVASKNPPENTDGATNSNLANASDGFDDDSWNFQDASSGSGAEDQTAGLGATNSNLANASDDFDDDSWNFQDASTGAGAEDQTTGLGATKSNLANASDDFDDDSWNFQDAHAGAGAEDQTASLGHGEINTQTILKLISSEDQSSYVMTWSKMLLVCSQELNHGVSIWKQLFEKDVHLQVLLTPQAKINIIALGEIYRTVQVLGASARVYAPWVLANSTTSSAHVSTLLSECSTLWSSSGLEEALRNISELADIEYDSSIKNLLESIKFIRDIDAVSLCNNILSTQAPTCGLSGLPSEMVPGLKTAVWNGKHYFLPLANLWANLISCDPPNLPSIHIEGQ